MDNDLELEGLLFEEEEQKISFEQESLESNESLSERWAAWVNIVNR